MNAHNIIEIEFGTPEYDEAITLRDQVLRKPLNLQFTEEQIAEEFNQIHFGYYNEHHELIACLSYQPKEDNILKMRQVAVDSSIQNKGIGSKLVLATEQWAKHKGFKKIILHARDTAVPFYNKLNYQLVDEPFTEVGIKHFMMEKYI
jgi:N-acetylglutamate synthase-like GNAT family acetyltransferase